MKKILGLIITLAAFATSFQSQARISSDSLNRSCQSQGEHEGRMVYIDLYQTKKNGYAAIFREADDTSSEKVVFLVVEDIQRDDSDSRIGHNFYDKNGLNGDGFSLVPDSEDLSSTYSQYTHIAYYYKGQLKRGTFACSHTHK